MVGWKTLEGYFWSLTGGGPEAYSSHLPVTTAPSKCYLTKNKRCCITDLNTHRTLSIRFRHALLGPYNRLKVVSTMPLSHARTEPINRLAIISALSISFCEEEADYTKYDIMYHLLYEIMQCCILFFSFLFLVYLIFHQ